MSKRRNKTNRAGAAVGMNYYMPQFRAKKKPREVRTQCGNCVKTSTDILTQKEEEKQDENFGAESNHKPGK